MNNHSLVCFPKTGVNIIIFYYYNILETHISQKNDRYQPYTPY